MLGTIIVEELSGEEVANRLGISLAAMKSRLHRARGNVRQYLDQALGYAPKRETVSTGL